MNHDPALSSPAQAGGPSRPDDGFIDGAHEGIPETQSQNPATASGRRRRRKKPSKRSNAGLKKKLTFVTHLLKGLDTVVFAELSALYYMECSLFRFIIRSAGQFMYLSPKDEAFPFLMPAGRMHVILILVPNLWCMLVHLFASLPEGPEYHRGYQQGGLIIDFVGQKPPTYRLYYFLADILLLGLQCLMLTIHTEREKLRVLLKTFKPLVPDSVAEAALGRTPEELGLEEQTLRGTQDHNGEDEDGAIEMQPLRSSTGETNRSRTEDPLEPVNNGSGDESSRSHLSDILNSGNGIIGEYHVLNALRVAFTNIERAAATSLQTIGYRATWAALEAQRRGVPVPRQTGQ